MKILFVTGSRGEWGYIRPIIKLCIKESIDYKICATNMMLLSSFGSLIDELKQDGYNVSDEILMKCETKHVLSDNSSFSLALYMRRFCPHTFGMRLF